MTPDRVESPRVGCVKYLNAQPLIHGWPGPATFDYPSTLCRQLAAAELDIALVSAFEFLRNPIYSIVDDVAVASNGAVYSVFVAYNGSVADIEEIALDPASSTSANLLRCLLAEAGLKPRLRADAAVASGGVPAGSAKLMIGDQAIRFRESYSDDYSFWDLGAEWKRATGLPFVFALWLIRPEVEEAAILAEQLRALRDANLKALENVIAAQKDFSPEFCATYFRDFLRFHLAEPEKKGLLLFRSLCQKHGILPPKVAPLRLA